MKKTIYSISALSPVATLALGALLLSGCVIDDSDTGGYYASSRPYYDEYPYDYPRYDGYRHRRDYDEEEWRYGRRDRDDRDRRRHDRDRHHDSARPGEFSAGGNAKEYAFGTGHHRCTIEVLDGSVGFRTIVVRRGGNKQPHTFNTTLRKGQTLDVPIDRDATGLRISDTGRGRYRVSVR